MHTEAQQLEAAIAALEAQRPILGDTVVEALLGPARARLAELAAMPPAEPDAAQTLRQVSILFLDVVGSTTLSQSLDPEAISAVMDDALARGTAIVQTHRGRVLQYAGDNILAAFGADEAREDDAERAVRCGLALLKLGRTLGAEVQRLHGHVGFDFRLGIHTGGVLLGGGVAEGSIRGLAVNIAARMEQTAPAGALRITQDTYALVRGLFEVQAQPPLQVKGVDEPVQNWLVDRPARRSFRVGSRGIEGLATRMVGRDAELATLQAALERVRVGRRLEAVTVVADAGMGKSRLLHEFESALAASGTACLSLRSRCTPSSAMQPLGVLRSLLAGLFGMQDDDTLPQAQAKFAAGIAPLFEFDEGAEAAQAHAHLLGHLLGIDHGSSPHIAGIRKDFGQIRTRALRSAVQWFRRTAQQEGRTVLLLLEDLHWADDGSLDFLAQLAAQCADLPLLLLGLARPTLDERRADWPGAGTAPVRIELQPLGAAASGDLLDELLQRLPDAPESLRTQLGHSAEGNPFYLEELVKMLIDQGAIRTDGDAGQWRLDAERLRVTRLPPTLTGVLQARLDALESTERLALQEASVIGPVFWAQALATLDPQAEGELPALVRKALAQARGEADDGLREYAFGHQLLHQATYGTVLLRLKRELHGKVARWMGALGGARAGDFLGSIAEHYERAGAPLLAADHHRRAAEHARERFAHSTVLHHAERGLTLLQDHPAPEAAAMRWDLHFARAMTQGVTGRLAEVSAELDALDRASVGLDDARCAYAKLVRVEISMQLGIAADIERLALEGQALAARAGHAEHGLRALFMLCSARLAALDDDGAIAYARQGLAQARQQDHKRFQAAFLDMLARTASRRGDLAGALEMARQAAALGRLTNDRRNEAVACVMLGSYGLALGQVEAALQDFAQGLRAARVFGNLLYAAASLANLSKATLWHGDAEAAREHALAAWSDAERGGSPDLQAEALIALGAAEWACGDVGRAQDAFGRARTAARVNGNPEEHIATAQLALLAVQTGDIAGASSHAAELAALDAATQAATSQPRLIEWAVHRALAAAGEAEQAEAWLARAHDALQTQQARLPDAAMKRDFIGKVPEHAAIVSAWAMRPQRI